MIKCQNGEKFLIVSDSKSVLTAVSSLPTSRTHPYIFNIRSLLYDLKQQNKSIHFLWVPSHMGIDGNEYADKVASSHTYNENQSDVLAEDLRGMDRSNALSSWQRRWCDSEFGRHLYAIAPNINKMSWFKNSNFPRQKITMVNRLKFNHTRCKDHICKIKIVNENICSCGSLQSTDHWLFHCPDGDRSSRLSLVDYLNRLNISNHNLAHLLKLNDLNIFSLIFNFYKKSNFEYQHKVFYV